MRLISSFLMIILPIISIAQDAYDQWGIVKELSTNSEDTVYRYYNNGSFSNSTASGLQLIAMIIDYGDAITIDLFEQGEEPGIRLSYVGSHGEISIERADGSLEKYNVLSPASGGIYIDSKNPLFEALRTSKKERIKFVINESAFRENGSSQYSFSLITK